MTRQCPNCQKVIVGHPNKRFCRQVCKDRYHNRTNPRGYGLTARVVHYCDECDEEGVATKATHVGASICHEGGKTWLCDHHAFDWIHPMSMDAAQPNGE